MKKWIYTSVICLLAGSLIAANPGDNKSQWRGADRAGIYHEDNLLKQWPEGGPELLWSVDGLGAGYASATVGNNAIFVTGITDTVEHLTALDLAGNIKWRVNYGRAWFKSYPHARCTPTVEGNRVYVISGSGEISSIDVSTGKIIWNLSAAKKFKASWSYFGVAENLLLVDEKLIYTPAGEQTTVIALNKNNGQLIWKTESFNDVSAYVSPIKINYAGKDIIIQVTSKQILGVNSKNGTVLFKHPYSQIEKERATFSNVNTISPLFHEDQIYVTSGYNHVGVAYKLNEDASAVSVAWVDTVLDVHHGGVVLVDGTIYGANWLNNKNGNWCAIDWKTGEKRYETEWFSKGSIVYADGHLYCYEEKRGHLALVKATPKAFDIVSSFKLPKGSGPHWAHPVIDDGVLYMRHGKELMAYKVK